MTIIHILIVLFTILILSQVFSNVCSLREGLENKPDSTPGYSGYSKDETAYMLAQKNSANIQVIHDQLKQLTDFKTTMDKIADQVSTNTSNITTIVNAQTQASSAYTGVSPPSPSSTQTPSSPS